MATLTGVRLPWANRAFVERLASLGIEPTDPADVRLAKSVVTLTYEFVELFVLAKIEIEHLATGLRAAHGEPHVFHPWQIADESLKVVGYEYVVPAD